MAAWTPLKRDVLDSLAGQFLHNYGSGRTLLAVDGGAAVGAAAFADDLAAALRAAGHTVSRASLDQSAGDGAGSPDDRYRAGPHYEQFTGEVIAPFRAGEGDAILVVDGAFLNRPELRGLWNWSIWLEGVGDASAPAYLAEAEPRTRASAIVDNSDPEHPRQVFADSC